MRALGAFRKLSILTVCLLGIYPIFGQVSQAPFIPDEELEGGETIRFDVFDGNSLWGYINGGADIYLEYGFEQVYVQEIRYKEENYKVEIFRMDDVESAYGKFSVSTFRCLEDYHEKINHYCETNYQIQFALSDKYISITNESGKEEGKIYNRHLASRIELKTKKENYRVPDLFCHDLFKSHINRMKLIKGALGLQNGFAFWSGKFDLPENFKLILLPIREDEGNANLAILEFESTQEREKFNRKNNLQEKAATIMKSWNYGTIGILILESSLPEEDTNQYIKVIEELLTKK